MFNIAKLPWPSVRIIWEYTTAPSGTVSGSLKIKSDNESESA